MKLSCLLKNSLDGGMVQERFTGRATPCDRTQQVATGTRTSRLRSVSKYSRTAQSPPATMIHQPEAPVAIPLSSDLHSAGDSGSLRGLHLERAHRVRGVHGDRREVGAAGCPILDVARHCTIFRRA